MLHLLLNLVGVHLEKAGHLANWSIQARGGIAVGWLILAALILAAAVFWMYSRSASHLGRFRRILLSSLRTLFLVMLLAILARPVLRLTIDDVIRRDVVVLVDISQSMGIPDLRSEEQDIKRAAIAKNLIDPAKGLEQPLDAARAATVSQISRMEILQAALTNPRLDLLHRIGREYSIQPYTFGTQVNDFGKLDASTQESIAGWVNSLKATEPLTRLGDAVTDILGRMRGQPVAGIVLITDGQSNSGRSIVVAAAQAKLDGVPIYIYGVGISRPKDIIVSNVIANDVAFINDELSVGVRVRNTGLAGQPAHLVLSLNDKLVDAQDITLDDSGEQLVPMTFTPIEKGKYILKARIEPRPDEASKDNNEATEPLRVVDDKIKVLYVEKSPRWEFQYLMAQFMRDRRVDFRCVLLDGDPALAEPDNSPYLQQFPDTAEALNKFDLLIVGDVDPHIFTPMQLQNIQQFNQVGGGALLFIAGREFNPSAYAHTPLADLLPIDITSDRGGFDPSIDSQKTGDQPIHLQLTQAGQESAMLRLSDQPQANLDIWNNFPPIFWDAPVFRAKPGATVLLVDSDKSKESKSGPMPVMVLGRSGVGQAMYLGTDNLWRWRKNAGEKYYAALWGQIVQGLSLDHLLGTSKKTRLDPDKEKYNVGDKVAIEARLYDDALKPVDLPEIKAYYQINGGDPLSFQLRPDGGQKGFYRGEFVAPAPGAYQCWVERDPGVKRDFNVVQTNIELSEAALNEKGLRNMAAASGGKFFREEDLARLPDELRNKSENIQSTYEVELWSSWLYLGLLLTVVTAEWILRKRAMMK